MSVTTGGSVNGTIETKYEAISAAVVHKTDFVQSAPEDFFVAFRMEKTLTRFFNKSD